MKKYVVKKRGFEGREYHTPFKSEADMLLEPGTIVDCYDENGIHWASYGCEYGTVGDISRQLPYHET